MVYLALIESGFSNSGGKPLPGDRDVAVHEGHRKALRACGSIPGGRTAGSLPARPTPPPATSRTCAIASARCISPPRRYNAGAGKVGRGLKRLGDDEEEEDNPDADFFRLYDTRFLRRETKDYVPKLIAAALIAKQPEKYGFPKIEGIDAAASWTPSSSLMRPGSTSSPGWPIPRPRRFGS